MDLGWKQDDGDARPNIQVKSFMKYLFILSERVMAVCSESEWVMLCVSARHLVDKESKVIVLFTP